MTTDEIIDSIRRRELDVYARYPVAFARGVGSRLWDTDGKAYLDFFCGLAVTSLGHCHPAIVETIRAQAGRLLHVSNLFHHEPKARLLELLCGHSFADRVFLCNSGAEANETAMKLARRYGFAAGGGRYEILAALGSFHGRTLATLAVTGQEKHRAGFEPLLPGTRLVPFADLGALERSLTRKTVAIMLEPIQGEGGVIVPPDDYLAGVRALCDREGLLLILDEVQVGLGRTGRLFAYETAGIRPDIVTLAKALGSGVPIGATLVSESVAAAMTLGMHGSTFGGNPLACAVAARTLEILLEDGVLERGRRAGARLAAALEAIAGRRPLVRAVRGRGLLLGMELDRPARPIVEACLGEGLVLNATAERVLRVLPPLVVTDEEIDEGCDILERVLARAGN
jgi:predicted acetylornithine/succinylornithine family transaminase